jgi:hypothetical protein
MENCGVPYFRTNPDISVELWKSSSMLVHGSRTTRPRAGVTSQQKSETQHEKMQKFALLMVVDGICFMIWMALKSKNHRLDSIHHGGRHPEALLNTVDETADSGRHGPKL